MLIHNKIKKIIMGLMITNKIIRKTIIENTGNKGNKGKKEKSTGISEKKVLLKDKGIKCRDSWRDLSNRKIRITQNKLIIMKQPIFHLLAIWRFLQEMRSRGSPLCKSHIKYTNSQNQSKLVNRIDNNLVIKLKKCNRRNNSKHNYNSQLKTKQKKFKFNNHHLK